MAKKPWIGANAEKQRTYGAWPDGSWAQIAPSRSACVQVRPYQGRPHPSGAPAAEFEIVFEMDEPDEPGGRHSIVLDTEQAHRLTALLTVAWRHSGGSKPFLEPDEPVSVDGEG